MSDSPVQVEEKVKPLIETDEERQVFQFFFKLQAEGTTNMFDATRYLMRDARFKTMSISTARGLLNRWMQHYEAIQKELVAAAADQEN